MAGPPSHAREVVGATMRRERARAERCGEVAERDVESQNAEKCFPSVGKCDACIIMKETIHQLRAPRNASLINSIMEDVALQPDRTVR